MNIEVHWHGYRYLSYEKQLAKLEASRLTGRPVKEFAGGLKIEGDATVLANLRKSTYFGKIDAGGQRTLVPSQARLEASVNCRCDGKPRSKGRQITRYSAHGLHEYRGKFNPQIVRAVGNILGIERGEWILDPFCGSGTTLLEALHNGWNAVGIDCNPLAVQISNAKIDSVRVDDKSLRKVVARLTYALRRRKNHISFKAPLTDAEVMDLAGKNWRDWLPHYDYLSKWFIRDVLVQIAAIFQEIDATTDAKTGMIAKVILSDLVRNASLQEPSDLRIRRRKEFPDTYNLVDPYLQSLRFKIDRIIRAKSHISELCSSQIALNGDIRNAHGIISNYVSQKQVARFDAVITSPPYVTGLPYIDTDRLSLVILDLVDADDILNRQKTLIGNREISKLERDHLLNGIDVNQSDLPKLVIEFCRKLRQSVGDEDGFRRQNVPAVVFRYFADMACGFAQVKQLLKPNAPFALVVGKNRTTLGGKEFSIHTPRLLIEIAVQHGFELSELIKLDTYQRYDLHRANSIRSEYLIILKAV